MLFASKFLVMYVCLYVIIVVCCLFLYFVCVMRSCVCGIVLSHRNLLLFVDTYMTLVVMLRYAIIMIYVNNDEVIQNEYIVYAHLGVINYVAL